MRSRFSQDHAEVIASRDLAQDQHSTDHRKPAHAGNGQRHARALTAFGQMFPIADQQEGRQRGKLPEHQQKQDVVAHHDPHHRALEEQQIGEELAHVVLAGEVEAGIGDDQKADAEDQESEEKPQAIEHQSEIQSKRREPVDAGHHDLSGKDRRRVGQKTDEGRERDHEGYAGAGLTTCGVHEPRQ